MHMHDTNARPGTLWRRPQVNPRALVEARLARGLTQSDLASACTRRGARTTQAEISRYEQGRHTPHPARLRVIAQVLGVQVDALLAAAAP